MPPTIMKRSAWSYRLAPVEAVLALHTRKHIKCLLFEYAKSSSDDREWSECTWCAAGIIALFAHTTRDMVLLRVDHAATETRE